jgi:acyl-CoA synthetase (AMP-forming)/AMP-acid ligase II
MSTLSKKLYEFATSNNTKNNKFLYNYNFRGSLELSLTYEEFLKVISYVKEKFLSKLEHKSLILIPLQTNVEILILFLASLYSGLSAIPIQLASKNELKKLNLILKNSKTKNILYVEDNSKLVEQLQSEEKLNFIKLPSISKLISNSKFQKIVKPSISSDIHHIQYSSGSTGVIF